MPARIAGRAGGRGGGRWRSDRRGPRLRRRAGGRDVRQRRAAARQRAGAAPAQQRALDARRRGDEPVRPAGPGGVRLGPRATDVTGGAAAAMVNLLGDLWADGEPDWAAALADPAARLHLYGKAEARPGPQDGPPHGARRDADESPARPLALRGGASHAEPTSRPTA